MQTTSEADLLHNAFDKVLMWRLSLFFLTRASLDPLLNRYDFFSPPRQNPSLFERLSPFSWPFLRFGCRVRPPFFSDSGLLPWHLFQPVFSLLLIEFLPPLS